VNSSFYFRRNYYLIKWIYQLISTGSKVKMLNLLFHKQTDQFIKISPIKMLLFVDFVDIAIISICMQYQPNPLTFIRMVWLTISEAAVCQSTLRHILFCSNVYNNHLIILNQLSHSLDQQKDFPSISVTWMFSYFFLFYHFRSRYAVFIVWCTHKFFVSCKLSLFFTYVT